MKYLLVLLFALIITNSNFSQDNIYLLEMSYDTIDCVIKSANDKYYAVVDPKTNRTLSSQGNTTVFP